jgi:diguanylate cyclase (GGDEF)-like protein
MGGEEFAVLLPDADLDKAVVIAERIREGVALELVMPRAVCLNGALSAMGSITVSLGCATLSDSDEGVDALLRSADAALYLAKRSGRDQVRATARPATPRVQN